MMNSRKYPFSLFLIGWITDILFRFFWLFLPAVLLILIGIASKTCLYIGVGLLLLDILLSLIDQLLLCQTCLHDSDNPDFQAFQDAISKDGSWRDNIGALLQEKMSDPPNEVQSDSEDEDKS